MWNKMLSYQLLSRIIVMQGKTFHRHDLCLILLFTAGRLGYEIFTAETHTYELIEFNDQCANR